MEKFLKLLKSLRHTAQNWMSISTSSGAKEPEIIAEGLRFTAQSLGRIGINHDETIEVKVRDGLKTFNRTRAFQLGNVLPMLTYLWRRPESLCIVQATIELTGPCRGQWRIGNEGISNLRSPK